MPSLTRAAVLSALGSAASRPTSNGAEHKGPYGRMCLQIVAGGSFEPHNRLWLG